MFAYLFSALKAINTANLKLTPYIAHQLPQYLYLRENTCARDGGRCSMYLKHKMRLQ
jgi:hypothetical protein